MIHANQIGLADNDTDSADTDEDADTDNDADNADTDKDAVYEREFGLTITNGGIMCCVSFVYHGKSEIQTESKSRKSLIPKELRL